MSDVSDLLKGKKPSMKRTIIILIQDDEKGGKHLRTEIVGDKLTDMMAQALIDEGLKATGVDLMVDFRVKK